VLLEARPVYYIFMSQTKGIPLSIFQLSDIIFCFIMTAVLILAMIFLPLKIAKKRIEEIEF
ncbi:MAG: hypothetical protein SV062_06880, partial [Thermodesulfobacteriota bacterium]|nr:hypothetical protein [Thermodesulfobacteriota bacterium]